MSDAIHYLELERKLAEDERGEYRSKLTEELRQERQEVKKIIDGGLAPDEFQKISAYLTAIDQAVDVVGKLEPRTL